MSVKEELARIFAAHAPIAADDFGEIIQCASEYCNWKPKRGSWNKPLSEQYEEWALHVLELPGVQHLLKGDA